MPKRIPLVLLLLAPLAKIATTPRLNKTPSHQLEAFFPLIPERLVAWIGGMKATLFATIVGLLMVGCMRDRITDYYDNGQKKWERHWKGQELDGPVTWWYESGQKRQQINYKDGKKHGPFIVWNEKGKELRRENYKDGEEVED